MLITSESMTEMTRQTYKRAISIAVILLAVVFTPAFASADATVLFSDSFGSRSDTVNNWIESESDSSDAKTSITDSRSGSTAGHARLKQGASITTATSTIGYENITLHYYWRGDNEGDDSQNSRDILKVLWRPADASDFIEANAHLLRCDKEGYPVCAWSEAVSISLPAIANNTNIEIQFLGDTNADKEEARIDEVSISGDPIVPAPGTLIVKKIVINDNGGAAVAGDFHFQVNGDEEQSFEPDEANDMHGLNELVVHADVYTVTELASSGYTTTYENCTEVTVVSGATEICTITNNDDAPSLTLQKIVVNDDEGTATSTDWTLTAAGPTSFSGQGTATSSPSFFYAGTYVLSESGPAGYAEGAWVCDGGNQLGGDITLALGELVVCRNISNDIPKPPAVISGEAVQIVKTTSAIINWSTDKPATSRVIYDVISHSDASTTEAVFPHYGYASSTIEDIATTTDHSVMIDGLSAGTVYYYRSISKASPESVGGEGSFTTGSPGGEGSVVASAGGGGGGGSVGLISEYKETTVTENTAIITWSTNYNATSRVVYDTAPEGSHAAGPDFGHAFSTEIFNAPHGVTKHTVIISGLLPGTTYYYLIISSDMPEPSERSFTTAQSVPILQIISPEPPPAPPVIFSLLAEPEVLPEIKMNANASPMALSAPVVNEAVKDAIPEVLLPMESKTQELSALAGELFVEIPKRPALYSLAMALTLGTGDTMVALMAACIIMILFGGGIYYVLRSFFFKR